MADDSLRPRPVPTTGQGQPLAPSLPADIFTGIGPPVVRLGETFITPYIREQLTKLGWKDGDPIPGDFGEQAQRVRERFLAERSEASWEKQPPTGYKPVKAEFVDIETLPDEYKTELKEYLAGYKQQVAEQDAIEARSAQIEAAIPDNVQGQMRQMTRQAMEAQAAAEGGLPTATVVGSAAPGGLADKMERLKAAQAASTAPAAPPAETPADADPSPSSGLPILNTICPRCLYDVTVAFAVEPTEQDKQGYLIATLGIGRFEKMYKLMNNHLHVFFRTLTTVETGKLHEQLSWETRQGRIMGDMEYMGVLMEYRLAMALWKIEVAGNPLKTMPTLEELTQQLGEPKAGDDTNAPTRLPELRDTMHKTLLVQEPMRLMVNQEHRGFQRLVEALEARCSEEDFWKGIKLPGSSS